MTIRKALLVGINAYPGAPLRGCLNDVTMMKDLLISHYGFKEEDIKEVLDGQATLAGMRAGLSWLAEGGNDSDAVRVFHYSGHGSYVADQNGDEPDGRDEALVPYDYQTAGMLIDDELGSIYDTFPRGGNLTLIMDSCHSGSVQRDVTRDVVFRYLPVPWEEQKRIEAARDKFAADRQAFIVQTLKDQAAQPMTDAQLQEKVLNLSKLFEKKRFGDVRVREGNILLAGCRDDQTSADAFITGDYHGAFTYYLVDTIAAANYQITYRDLADGAGKKLYDSQYTQVPQLNYRVRRDRQPIFSAFAT